MYIVKVEDNWESDGIITTNLGTVTSEEKAKEYCSRKNSARKSLRNKEDARLWPFLDKDFISTLTPEEKEMYDGKEDHYLNPTWKYEKLEMLCM